MYTNRKHSAKQKQFLLKAETQCASVIRDHEEADDDDAVADSVEHERESKKIEFRFDLQNLTETCTSQITRRKQKHHITHNAWHGNFISNMVIKAEILYKA
jgi:16S rRNA C1402 N4-methylase RsmH